ncbi:AAA family ATPase [Kitasatospora saccharophila]|uniref:AAA family ATPase n=2 Tax=Kitasatospora saccharophila TaxID=407973 RepID=A0ABN2XQK1_9ACTN
MSADPVDVGKAAGADDADEAGRRRAALPSWVRELELALAVHPQILFTGNVRDQYLLPSDLPHCRSPRLAPFDLAAVVDAVCRARGYGALAVVDQVTDHIAVRLLAGAPDEMPPVIRELVAADARAARAKEAGEEDEEPALTDRLRDVMVAAVRHPGPPVGLLVPYAARLGSARAPAAGEVARLFAAVEELGHTARPVRRGDANGVYNTVFWVVERQEELPMEFPVGSRAVRVVSVPAPPYDQRLAAARHVVDAVAARQDAADRPDAAARETAARALADSSHGMGSSEVMAIGRMAVDRGLPAHRLEEAARLYRVGVTDNPWATEALRERIRDGEEFLNARVIGQPHAVRRTLEIFMRSASGLSGAQSSSSPNRPRGTLFLSGPTGVGKTELAKGIAEMILGKDARPIRFDMSEFAEEHARDRLIGAPPGYVGHDAGGELTNAVRANPMSVLLFDEIDKANPRLFDLFLQILEDGRLTDGRGATVYFTECVLIFTSNLGAAASAQHVGGAPADRPPVDGSPADSPSADGSRADGGDRPERRSGATRRLSRHDDPTAVRLALREAFDLFFNDHIKRPELRNRFGDNFIPMDFMQEKWVPRILDKAIAAVAGRILEVHGATLEVGEDAWEVLRVEAGVRLDHGGRGVLTAVESALVNPLSRELFRNPPRRGERIEVTAVEGDGDADGYTVEVTRWPG